MLGLLLLLSATAVPVVVLLVVDRDGASCQRQSVSRFWERNPHITAYNEQLQGGDNDTSAAGSAPTMGTSLSLHTLLLLLVLLVVVVVLLSFRDSGSAEHRLRSVKWADCMIIWKISRTLI